MDNFNNHPFYKVHNIDTAMNSLWEFYRKNFLILFAVSAVMSFAVQYISSFVDLGNIQSETDLTAVLDKMKEMFVPLLIISLVNLIFSTIIQHYIIYKPIDSNNTIFRSVIKSFRYYLPYIIVLILLSFFGGIAIVLGLLALIIGAFFALIYVMMLYLFILPIMMVEGTDIAHVIRRSFSFAHRNFWMNFGWVSTFIVIVLVISLVLSGIILLPFAGSFLKTIFNSENAAAAAEVTKSPVYFILSALVNALTVPLMPIFAAILYFNGKAREEYRELEYQPDKQEERVRVEDLYAKPYSDDHPDNPDRK
jgi:hypothetical protein